MNSIILKYPQSEKIHRIPERRQKYKRSTNNSHKKFICLARKLLFKLCSYAERQFFQKEYQSYQNSRVYYFIILAHVKIRMNQSQRQNFKKNLTKLLEAKIATFKEQIHKTNNKNFINFRFQEIADIEYSLKALLLYLQNKVEEAIEVIYKKQKGFVLKKQQYQMALCIVKDLEKKLMSFPEGQLFPYSNQMPSLRNGKQIIQNEGRCGKEEDEEWLAESWYLNQNKLFKEKRKDQIATQKAEKIDTSETPLLFLQNSYPIFPHFYGILFNYQDPLDQFYNRTIPHQRPYEINNVFNNREFELLQNEMSQPDLRNIWYEPKPHSNGQLGMIKQEQDRDHYMEFKILPPEITSDSVKLIAN